MYSNLVKVFVFLTIFLVMFILYTNIFANFTSNTNFNNNENYIKKTLSTFYSSTNATVKIAANSGKNNMKTILVWNSYYGFTEPYVTEHCPYKLNQCFVTNDRNHLNNIEDFEAILFHTPNFHPKDSSALPRNRSEHQLYAMFSLESPSKYPPESYFDNFFNVTITYRLDSDIHDPYIYIYDKVDGFVAPSYNPLWLQPKLDERDVKKYMNVYRNKSKPVAWFVSNCRASNKRNDYVRELSKYIQVDIMGRCGNVTLCDNYADECGFTLLKNDYYFYLSFENSNCVDYVTEKLYKAYKSDVIPVVMNGADMKTVGMPHSFLDVRNFKTAQDLAEEMKRLIANPREYIEYFWWKRYYYVRPRKFFLPFCELCKRLHDEFWKPKKYSRMREWINGTYERPMCDNR